MRFTFYQFFRKLSSLLMNVEAYSILVKDSRLASRYKTSLSNILNCSNTPITHLHLKTAVIVFISFFAQALPAQNITAREVIRIPVVIHVLFNDENQNISDEQITLQIESLNKDFSRTNENYDSTPEYFKSFSADMEIQFCLATSDENGNPSSGITRTETSVEEIGLTELFFKDDQGGKSPWNTEKYVNIWVADFGNTEILGSTPLAGEASPQEKDGILINYKYFGVDGSHQDENRKGGKVLTHEMGHYLGLIHIWGSLNNMCSDDDNILDTPLQGEPTFGCPSFPSPDECTQGNGIMYCNFMDYTHDECLTMFTEGQKTRVLEVLDGLRDGLVESGNSACITPIKNQEPLFVDIYPNPCTQYIKVLYTAADSKRSLKIYDMTGQVVLLAAAKSLENTLNVSALDPGIYFVETDNITRKIIITR